MKKLLLFAIPVLLFGNCDINDDNISTPFLLPTMGLNVKVTALSSWYNEAEGVLKLIPIYYRNRLMRVNCVIQNSWDLILMRKASSPGRMCLTMWIRFLILDIEYPLPNTEGRSIYIQLIRKEALNYVSLDPETDTYSYNDPEDFKTRFLHEGDYDEGDHYARVITTYYETDYPDYEPYAMGFPTPENHFQIRQVLETNLGMIVSGTFYGKCYIFPAATPRFPNWKMVLLMRLSEIDEPKIWKGSIERGSKP